MCNAPGNRGVNLGEPNRCEVCICEERLDFFVKTVAANIADAVVDHVVGCMRKFASRAAPPRTKITDIRFIHIPQSCDTVHHGIAEASHGPPNT